MKPYDRVIRFHHFLRRADMPTEDGTRPALAFTYDEWRELLSDERILMHFPFPEWDEIARSHEATIMGIYVYVSGMATRKDRK